MIRGTTAPFKFKLPYKWEKVCAIRAIFSQVQDNGELLSIIKSYDTRWVGNENPGGFKEDEKDSSIVYVVLNSNETLQFSDKRKGKVQIKSYCSETNTVSASKLQKFTVYPIENDEVLETPGDPSIYDDTFILDAGEISIGGES